MLNFYASTILDKRAVSMLRMARRPVKTPATLQERLLYARKAKGATQTEVGKAAKVSRGAVSLWEAGKTANLRMEALIAVCDYLRVEVRWLVLGKGPMKSISGSFPPDRLARWLDVLSDLPSEKESFALEMFEALRDRPEVPQLEHKDG